MGDSRRYFPDIVFTEKRVASHHFFIRKVLADSIDIVTEEKDVEKSLKTLFQNAKIIRSKIIDANKR